MGDFPMMTARGTFIINGTERIVVSQLVRSPGVYFGVTPDKTAPEKEVVDAKMIPSRGAWLEFEVDKKDVVYVRIDRKRKQPVTVLLKALGFGESEEELLALITDEHGRPYESMRNTLDKDSTATRRRSVHRHLPQAAAGRAADARLGARAAREPVLQHQALRPGEGRPPQGVEEAVEGVPAARARALRPRDPERRRREPQRRLHAHEVRHPRGGLVPREAAQPRRRLFPRRHRPLRQPPGPHRRRTDPEPAPRRPLPHGARRARAHDDPRRRGDHAADAHQHPARGRGDQGVLRLLAAVAVHGPDEPARRAHAQAAPLGARARRSVARARRASRCATSTRATTAACARSRRRKVRTSASSATCRATRASTGSASSRRRTGASSAAASPTRSCTSPPTTKTSTSSRRRTRTSTRPAASSTSACSCGPVAARSATSPRARSTTWTSRRSSSSRSRPR